MFHIPNDLRAKKSADLIIQALYRILLQKPLKEIKISDIFKNSFVSRATFYRLFDSVEDVILYQCDQTIAGIAKNVKGKNFQSKEEMAIYCVKAWLEHDVLVQAIVQNKLYATLYEAFMLHEDEVKGFFGIEGKEENQIKYTFFFLVSNLYVAFLVYYKENGKKQIEEVVVMIKEMCANIIGTLHID